MGYVILFIVVQVLVAGVVILVLNHLLKRELIEAALEKLHATLSSDFNSEIIVTSVSPIDDALRSRIKSIVARKSKEAGVLFEEDASIKSGLIIQIGQTVLDFSLANRLKNLRS